MDIKHKLKEISDKNKELESLENELADMNDNDNLHTLDPNLIKGNTARKNIQSMIRAQVQAEYDAILAEIDESPSKAFKHFRFGKLSDADKATFKSKMKSGLEAKRDKLQQEINKINDIKF